VTRARTLPHDERPRRRRRPRAASVALLLAVLGVAALSQLVVRSAAHAASPVPQRVSAADATQLARGRELFGSGCASCHGQQGQGTARGPDLRGVGEASADFQLSTGRMPLDTVVEQPQRQRAKYDKPDIAALVAYVGSLGTGGPSIPDVAPGHLQSGRELFLQNCASCHGSTGAGAAMVDGEVAPTVLHDDSTLVAEAMRVGPGLMPQFPPSALSDQQVDDITTYVRNLPQHSGHGGWSIGLIGPVPEGLVGWVLGLGALLVVVRLLGKRAPKQEDE
jgi:ubiquinol-cytochrome c reductase cytochrome c subunit